MSRGQGVKVVVPESPLARLARADAHDAIVTTMAAMGPLSGRDPARASSSEHRVEPVEADHAHGRGCEGAEDSGGEPLELPMSGLDMGLNSDEGTAITLAELASM